MYRLLPRIREVPATVTRVADGSGDWVWPEGVRCEHPAPQREHPSAQREHPSRQREHPAPQRTLR